MDDYLGKGSTIYILRLSVAVAVVRWYAAAAIVVGLDVKATSAFPDKNIRTECAVILLPISMLDYRLA
jgi:hypothetical protein